VQELGGLLGFDPADLALNRAHRLSPHQITEGMRVAGGSLGFLFVSVGIGLTLAFLGRPGAFRAVAGAAIGLAAGGAAALGAWDAGGAAIRPAAVTTEGILAYERSRAVTGTMMVVGSFRMALPRGSALPHKLPEGGRFRVYYVRQTGTLLSMEPAAAAQDSR
jgi:hypothetical protein